MIASPPPSRGPLSAVLRSRVSVGIALLSVLPFIGSPAVSGQEAQEEWDVTLARGETREIDFRVDEGTWMSVDHTPDGRWVVFDLLGHIYRVEAGGGAAESLTQDSGVAVNFHPRVSPDGRYIAFVSDRGGQNNLWVMGIDGSDPRSVFQNDHVRVVGPAWSPDGEYIYVQRTSLAGGDGRTGIFMFHRDGGDGIEVVGSERPGAAWPSPSQDGRYLYFQERAPGSPVFWTEGGSPEAAESRPGELAGMVSDILQGALQVRRLDLRSGEITPVSAGYATRQLRLFSGGAYAPEVSPDGRLLAFARRIPDGRISFKGHEFGPRTALWVRDLETGAERVVMDPIEQDLAEGLGSKADRVLPGYNWSPDSRSILISQGGRIRSLNVDDGSVSTIPFEAPVRRTISEQAYTPVSIDDGPLRIRFLRWYTGEPGGDGVAFEGAGRVWVMDRPGADPRRLTPDGFGLMEYGPAWSPDGAWIAFTTWEDGVGGHVWRVPAGGGEPERLTEEPGEYVNPEWSPDGRTLVIARGSGATYRARTLAHNAYWDVVTLPASGGATSFIERVALPTGMSFFVVSRSQIVRPSFSNDGRIFFQRYEDSDGQGVRTALISVRPDGLDRIKHFTFPFADEILPSPDGRWVAFNEGDNVYLTPFPQGGAGGKAVHLDKTRGVLPVEQLSLEGGLYPRWKNARTLEFGSGTRYYAHDVGTQATDTVDVRLEVPRYLPEGSLAFSGGRIVTLEDGEVIEEGDLVVQGARIACVGPSGTCDLQGVDRVVDVSGQTLIPGLIDMHSHFFREHRGIIPRQNYEAAVALAYGVTTNLDNSMWSQDVFPAAEMIETGTSIGPRTFSTGDPLYAGDRGRQNELTSYEVAEQNVQRLHTWGAVSIKQYFQPRRDQRQWVSEAARRIGVMVTGEGGDLFYNLGTIMDGQTGWEHPFTYVPLYSDVAQFFGQAQTVYSATPVVGGPGPWNDEYFFQESDVWRNEKLRRWTPWRQLIPHSRRRVLRPESDYSFPLVAQGVADIIEHGGYGAIGAHGQQHGIASHWEVWILASAMGPMGALEVASKHGAYFLGALDDLGTLTEGKLADVVILNSNPLDDIRNTEDIRYVMKGGVLYDGDTLDEIWPTERSFGPHPWLDEDALRDDVRPVDWWDSPR
jgi:Tol biopolymer transport system component